MVLKCSNFMMLGGRSSWYVQVQVCFISCAFDPRPSAISLSLLSPVIKVLIQDFTQMTYRSNLSKYLLPTPIIPCVKLCFHTDCSWLTLLLGLLRFMILFLKMLSIYNRSDCIHVQMEGCTFTTTLW